MFVLFRVMLVFDSDSRCYYREKERLRMISEINE